MEWEVVREERDSGVGWVRRRGIVEWGVIREERDSGVGCD